MNEDFRSLKDYEESKEIFYDVKEGSITDFRRYTKLTPIEVSCGGYLMASNTIKRPFLLEIRGFPPHTIENVRWIGREDDFKFEEVMRGKIKITESRGYGVAFRFFHNHDKKSYELAQIFVKDMEKRVRSLKWRHDVFKTQLYKVRGLSDRLMFFLDSLKNKHYPDWLDALKVLNKESPELYQDSIKRNLTVEEKRFLKKITEDGEKLKEMLKYGPRSENGLREIFDLLHHFFGFRILHYNTSFPDYLLLRNGEEIRAEAELYSSSFKIHKHNPKECDMIVCWENNIIYASELGLDIFELATHQLYRKDGTIEDLLILP